MLTPDLTVRLLLRGCIHRTDNSYGSAEFRKHYPYVGRLTIMGGHSTPTRWVCTSCGAELPVPLDLEHPLRNPNVATSVSAQRYYDMLTKLHT